MDRLWCAFYLMPSHPRLGAILARIKPSLLLGLSACAISLVVAGLSQVDAAERSRKAQEMVGPETRSPTRQARLGILHQRLRQAQTPARARIIAKRIESVWRESGSSAINLLLVRSIALIKSGDYDVARALLDTVVTSAPNFAEGWSQRAMVNFKQGNYRAALHDLNQVLALEPRHFRALQGVAVILSEFGEDRGALQAYRRVLKIYPLKKEAREAVKDLAREVEGQDI